MKVLLVNKYLYPKGGAETYVLKLGKALWEAGCDVQYFGMEDDRNVVGNEANAYTEGIDFHKSSIKYLTYPFKIIYSFKAKRQIRKVIEDFKPDIVHLNNFNFQLTPSIIYEIKKHNIPIVYTAHDVQFVCPNHKLKNGDTEGLCRLCYDGKYLNCVKHKCVHNSLLRSILGAVEGLFYRRRHTYRLIDKIICPSRFMERELCHNVDVAGRTLVLYNFIEDIKPEGKEKKGYVLYFGRYSEEKGIKTLLQAAKALPQIKFKFAGRGELEEEIEKVSNIKNLGFLTGDALNATIERAMFTVLPAEWSENCPFSVMESQTLLTPVLGAEIGGIPELIIEDRTGMLFESGNGEDLKNKIEYLWSNPKLCESMSESCKNITYDKVKEYTEKLLKIYKELVK